MDEADTSKPVQQVGLVAVFYLVDASLPVRRKHIAEAFALYDKHFGNKLRGGYRGEMGMTIQPYTRETFTACYEHITAESAMNDIEFAWMSQPSFGHASDYMVDAYSPAGWYEKVHKAMTSVRFYLPVIELTEKGRGEFEQFFWNPVRSCAHCTELRALPFRSVNLGRTFNIPSMKQPGAIVVWTFVVRQAESVGAPATAPSTGTPTSPTIG